MADNGWVFGDSEGAVPDDVNGAQFLHQIYTLADSIFSGRVTDRRWARSVGRDGTCAAD